MQLNCLRRSVRAHHVTRFSEQLVLGQMGHVATKSNCGSDANGKLVKRLWGSKLHETANGEDGGYVTEVADLEDRLVALCLMAINVRVNGGNKKMIRRY